ncbi:GNAT family N-acetyltransferase [Taibaiella koreensis]|uniref:GNAT family N-acetyltransferase n=1 Tax=Taibaiella koreensis TaxID=1268548 RepID=UPI000E59E9E4|nr:GNAT family N-acetyltransferase [Taibaiella koreensis]
MTSIRIARLSDLPRIVDIYNQAVLASFETGDTAITTVAQRQDWFRSHQAGRFPVYVCEADGVVAGWLSLSPYRAGRDAFRFTAEVSYYLDKDYRRRGIGSSLLQYALDAAAQLQFKTLFGIILDRNRPSIELLKKFGFVLWGHMPAVADFDGQPCGHVYYGRHIGPAAGYRQNE